MQICICHVKNAQCIECRIQYVHLTSTKKECIVRTLGQEMYSHHFLPFHKALNFLVCKTLLHCMCTFYNSNNYHCLGIFGWLRYFTKYHQKKSITSVILNNGLKTVRTSVSENCLLQPTKWLFLFYRVFHMIFSKSKWS